MRKIVLASNLRLSAVELATSVTSVLGIRGSGKSNLAAVLVEGFLDAQIPVVVLDRVGIWFSLRLDRDGKTPSRYEIPVLGGAHGDIALLPSAGAQVAEALAAGQSSAVLDISRFSQAGRIKFATEFAETFFEAKKRHPGPVCLVLEEAQRYVPQTIRFSDGGLPRCLGAFEEIAEQGRNYGVGLVLISLRPEKLNKDVMNLSENVFALRMLGVQERKVVAEWVQEHGVEGRDDVKNELPSLRKGRAIFWSPALFEVYGKYDLLLKSTYDAGKTPHEVLTAVAVKPLDLAALEASMASVVEEAKANDPRALKVEVARLRGEAREARAPGSGGLAPEGGRGSRGAGRLAQGRSVGERHGGRGVQGLDVVFRLREDRGRGAGEVSGGAAAGARDSVGCFSWRSFQGKAGPGYHSSDLRSKARRGSQDRRRSCRRRRRGAAFEVRSCPARGSRPARGCQRLAAGYLERVQQEQQRVRQFLERAQDLGARYRESR